jgi:hypothetical protein
MISYVLAAVLVVVAGGYVAARLHRHLAAQWFLGVVWRFLSGHRRDDKPGRVRRAAWRTGGALTVLALVAGWFASPQVTAWIVVGLAISGLVLSIGLAVRLSLGWRHYRRWLRPLHLAAHPVAQVDRRRPARQWLAVEPDRSKAVLALPSGWPADDKDKQRLVAITAAKLGIESPEVSWRLAGPKPQLELTASQPPPRRVVLADVRDAIDRAKPDQMVWGLGKRGAVVDSSLSGDSPHLGLSMGSGAGKSVTAGWLLAQMLYRGCIGLVLDHKMISHQWAAGLPNVAIARRPHEIYQALVWLGREVERRNEVALAGADMDGNVHATVGPRLIVVGEELNATVTRQRAYWRQIRGKDDPVRSPALEALDSASFMGRQILTNIMYIGQRLSVKASGGDGDARENIGVLAFGRYTPSNWKMLAGDHPMPPKSLTPGRIQLVTDRVRETQAVYTTAAERRALALAGEIGVPRSDMPFVGRVPGTPELTPVPGPGQPFVPGTGTAPLLPSGRVTLRQAIDDGVITTLNLEALRKASQRDGFPGRAGHRGLAGEWDAVELAEWEATRR